MYAQSEVNNHYHPSLASEQTVHSTGYSRTVAHSYCSKAAAQPLLGALCSRHLVPNQKMLSLVMRGVDLISWEEKC